MTTASDAVITARLVLTVTTAVLLRDLFDRRFGKEPYAAFLAGPDKPGQIFEGMKRSLTRIAKNLPVLAALERHADEAMHRRSDLAYHFEFLIDDIRRHAVALKQVAIEAPEVALDFFGSLDFFDTVNRGGLALIENLRGFETAQLFELATSDHRRAARDELSSSQSSRRQCDRDRQQ